MLATTVTTCLDHSRLYLNDIAKSLYTDAVLLPSFRIAYQEMEDEFELNGVPRLAVVDTDQTITAVSGLEYTLPSDFLFPITLFEKGVGEDNDHFVQMNEVRWLPNRTQDTILVDWQWANNKINFVGASINRVVRLRYKKTLGTISLGSDSIQVPNSWNFLAARTAELAARFLGKDRERADYAKIQGDKYFETMLSSHVNRMQSVPVRQRSFSRSRRRGRLIIPQ